MPVRPTGFWSARSARAARAAKPGASTRNIKSASLEVEMDPRFQEADPHRLQNEASGADVLKRAAALDREAQALDAGNEKLGTEAAEELRAGARVGAQDAATEHEVEV